MKIIGKIRVLLFIACIVSLFSTMNVDAATGRIKFSDPTTAAGDEFEVSIELITYDETIDRFSIEFEYDSEMLQYKSSEYTILEDGKLIFNSDESGMDCKETLVFRALKNGTTSITISNQEVANPDGTVFEISEGNSLIVVEGGQEVSLDELSDEVEEQPVSGEQVIVQVQGVDYGIKTEFLESKLPMGFECTEMEVEGLNCMVAKSENSETVLVFLEELNVESEEGEDVRGRFFIYDTATGIFTPYIQVKVSDSTYIAFLSEDYTDELPIRYVPTTMNADGFEFTAWEDSQEQGYYIVYAVNHNGEKMLYRYDLVDQSYQRYEIEQEPVNPNAVSDEKVQELVDFIADNLIVSALIAGLIILFLFILTLVFGIKLSHRNKELDDIYLGSGMIDLSNLDSEEDEYMDDYDDLDDQFDLDRDAEKEYGESEYQQSPVLDNQGLEMLDDGLTQEFNIAIDESYLSDNGFMDFANNEVKHVTTIDEDKVTMDDIDIDEDEIESELFEETHENDDKQKRKMFGRKKKEIKSDDDDGFEFIEL